MLALLWVPVTHAQWSADPSANLVLADRSGPQVQPKIVARADGGFYVSWFDSSTGGYDVYLQRLDAAGVEQWPHDGVLVADRSYSSTQDYGLAVDTAGNALLAFRDDRGGVGDDVTVAKISPDGVALWGPSGVQAWSGGGFVAMPKVAGTSDGNVVVGWTRDSDAMVQKLDPDGAPLWGAGVTLSPTSGSFVLSDLRAADAGNAIVSFVYQPVFMTNHLWAQKLAAADGGLLWGAGHVQVFDAGSLQMGNFPPFKTDGSGGAVFAWYTNSPSLQCRVQRVLANGSEAFVHQGVEVSTVASRLRVGPSAGFLPATQETVVFWTEENSNQSQWGLYGQKLDAAGARQWTDSGRELVPLGSSQITNVVTLPFADGAVVAWSDGITFGNDPIRSTRVDGAGDFVWDPSIVDLKTSATGTSRLDGALSTQGFAAFAWSDGDSSIADILAQNLNGDGSLGVSGPIFTDGFESGDSSGWSATVP
jgi:hypothetical protein